MSHPGEGEEHGRERIVVHLSGIVNLYRIGRDHERRDDRLRDGLNIAQTVTTLATALMRSQTRGQATRAKPRCEAGDSRVGAGPPSPSAPR